MGLFKKKDKDTNISKPEEISQIEKNGVNIFKAYKKELNGPSYYFYINKKDDDYLFLYGYSDLGITIDNDIDEENINVMKQNEMHYKLFLEQIEKEVEKWHSSYNKETNNGLEWNINIVEHGKIYKGIGELPSNFIRVMFILNKFFDVKNGEEAPKNDGKLVESWDENPDLAKLIGLITISLNNKDSRYIFQIRKDSIHQSCKLSFYNFYNLSSMRLDDMFISVPLHYYDDFINKSKKIISSWDNKYKGNREMSWNLIALDSPLDRKIVGEGEVPSNWNEFIDLLKEYEILFKCQQDIKNGKKEKRKKKKEFKQPLEPVKIVDKLKK